jgi:REP element-mobilizing transposase RayT
MDKYKNTYRIPSNRWKAWNYARNAPYFVTICTRQKTEDFGQISNGKMVYTTLGHAATRFWMEIPNHFPFVELGEFVVMPNHVHGIVVINKPDLVETQNLASLQNTPKNKFGPQSQNLASIIRGYKVGVTKYAHQCDIPFLWQERYYDHVIRNMEEHERIRLYILTNVQKWSEDKFSTGL